MCQQVPEQNIAPYTLVLTFSAFIWLFSSMNSFGMAIQMVGLFLSEGFHAKTAPRRFSPSVDEDVILQMSLTCETASTCLTFVWFFSRVCAHVDRQI